MPASWQTPAQSSIELLLWSR